MMHDRVLGIIKLMLFYQPLRQRPASANAGSGSAFYMKGWALTDIYPKLIAVQPGINNNEILFPAF